MKDDFISNIRKDVLHEQKHKDGITHIVVGSYLIFIAALGSEGKMNLAVVFIPFIPVMMSILKKRITYPRIGYAQVEDKTTFRGLILGFIALLLLLGVGLKLYFQNHSIPPTLERNLAMLGIGMILILLIAYRYFKERNTGSLCYGLAILGLLGVIYFGQFHQYNLMQIMFILGIADFFFGIIQLIKFIKKYPVVKDET